MKAHVESYGCTANHGRNQWIEHLLRQQGHEITSLDEADLVVVNTCTVTKSTEQRMLHRIKELSKEKKVLAAGCLAKAQEDLLDVETIKEMELDTRRPPVTLDGVIGTVNVAEGCVGNCSYCIVRLARGRLQSYPPDDIVHAARRLIDGGARELRLTAQDLAAYGLDHGTRLPELVQRITDLEGEYMVRLGMMNPNTTGPILDDLLDAYESPRVYRFLHVPVQSGSDEVLRDMNRGHTTRDFTRIIRAFRERYPDSVVSTDFIVGYPTETEEDFQLTMDLLKDTGVEKVNITRYSPRPGTPAYDLERVASQVKKRRSGRLTELHHRITRESMRELVGEVVDVIPIRRKKQGSIVARDRAYRPIILPDTVEPGRWVRARVTEERTTYLIAEVLP